MRKNPDMIAFGAVALLGVVGFFVVKKLVGPDDKAPPLKPIKLDPWQEFALNVGSQLKGYEPGDAGGVAKGIFAKGTLR